MTARWQDFFAGKTVTQMGLGLLGRGAGDAGFLAQHCRKLFVTDTKTETELRRSLDTLKLYTNIEFVFGGHDYKNFEGVDFVLKGAGVRLDNPYIEHARGKGIPVYMSTALFAHLAPIKIVGVTGTRGKTTTTCMIADILKHAGKRVLLGGNIRGVSTLAMLPEAHQYDIAVLELDSWQLQGFNDLGISPHISVFTNFYPDHMNYYDGDMDRYFSDKSAIFRHQKAGDVTVVSPQIAELAKARRENLQGGGEWRIAASLPSGFDLKVPGGHNIANAGLAKEAACACGISDEVIDNALRQFAGVEGRLQFAGAWDGRDFYNDSNATTQEATLAALTAFPPEATVLIFGGADKQLPIDRMLDYIGANKIRAVLIKGTGSDRVLEQLPHLLVAGSMSDAVRIAKELSKPGDKVILSPAFASFGVFKNEYDRSDQFMNEVRGLTGGKNIS